MTVGTDKKVSARTAIAIIVLANLVLWTAIAIGSNWGS